MSLHYTMKRRPPEWVSAHRKCEFAYAIQGVLVLSAYDDGDGYLQVNLSSTLPFSSDATVGTRVYINTGTYEGYHVIREVVSTTQYVFETLYTGGVTGIVILLQVKLPTVSVYKGYASGELILPLYPSGTLDLYTIQPRTLAATFAPEFGLDGLITFDISGYLKAIMVTPYKVGYNVDETDYNYAKSATVDYVPLQYHKVDIMIEGNLECTLYVANTALDQQSFNRYFVYTGRPLYPLIKPPLFDIGVNNYDIIDNYQINRINV